MLQQEVINMLKLFKKKLESKFVFFQFNKLMVQTIYKLRKYSLEDERKNQYDIKLKVQNCSNEAAVLSFFLTSQALKLTKIDQKISADITSLLKGYCLGYLINFEKDEGQKFLEARSNTYFETFREGFNEAEICSIFLDFIGIEHNESQIIENFGYTSLIELTFLSTVNIITITEKKCRLVSGIQISKQEWNAHFEEIKEVKEPEIAASETKQLSNNDDMASKYKTFSDDLKLKGTYDDQISSGYGPFGLTKTNPIPTTSTAASVKYLKQLRLNNGEPITYRRFGSTSATEVTEGMIDIYNIYSNGETITTFYLCPYHNKDSERIPDGFETIVSS